MNVFVDVFIMNLGQICYLYWKEVVCQMISVLWCLEYMMNIMWVYELQIIYIIFLKMNMGYGYVDFIL